MADFGKKFREAREKKGLSYDDVSNVTKISSRMLQAIEDEHFDLLPGGVFNKGFIRAYAKHLGLDAEEAVTDYLACLRQAQVDAQEVWEPAPVAPAKTTVVSKPPSKPANKPANNPVPPKPAPKPAAPVQVEELPELQLPRAEDVRPPRRDLPGQPAEAIPWRIIAATTVVIILAALLWIRHNRTSNTQAATGDTKPATTQSAVPTAPAAVTQSPVTTPGKNSTPSPSPSSASASTAPAAPPPDKVAPPTPAAKTEDTGDVTVRNFGAPPAKRANSKASNPLSLVIRANETSWISVVADGQLVTQETLIAPAHSSVRAAHEINVRIGNAAGITFIFNGKEIPASGAESEVKSFTFDESGMKFVPTP